MEDPILSSVHFKKWEQVFTYLTGKLFEQKTKGKTILFLDELQWMAAGRRSLIALLKFYWDNHWKDKKVMLILCGSVATFMINKVLHSHALYGRVTLQLLLKGLDPHETKEFFKNKRSHEEILKYQLVFGGVPKYHEQIDLNRSFNQNINTLCFSSNGIMLNEIQRIFYDQFRESKNYLKIVNALKNKNLSQGEISKKTKIVSGGGLKLYLENLERAEIIRSIIPFDRGANSKFKKFTLSDEFIMFYFKYVEPNLRIIHDGSGRNLFEKITSEGFDSWLGFAFERFCLKHSNMFASIMRFSDEVLFAAPFFGRNDAGFQIDMLYKRADKVITLCEVKHRKKKIQTNIIPEIEKKCSLLKIPRGYSLEKALISLYGPDESLRDAGYFHHIVSLEDFLG